MVMKRHQIKRMIGNVSDAQLRKAINDLGLPSEDDHNYEDEQVKQILTQFKKPQQPQSVHDDRLAQSRQLAQQAADTAKITLVNGHQERLVALTDALDKAEQRRDEVLERLSDRVAYLQDDSLFMNDLLRLAQSKLKQNQQQQPDKQEVTVTALDALVDAFDAVGDWELPAIVPSSALGCLPM